MCWMHRCVDALSNNAYRNMSILLCQVGVCYRSILPISFFIPSFSIFLWYHELRWTFFRYILFYKELIYIHVIFILTFHWCFWQWRGLILGKDIPCYLIRTILKNPNSYWSWISPWTKAITFHVLASQLSGHCDVINNRLWCHQQER